MSISESRCRPERNAMPGSPKLSIGLPVYNGSRYLEETVLALLRQSFEDFELIICDNASTDSTRRICEDFCRRDKRVRLLRSQENVGAAANYNKVFAKARGEYFKWAAADDLCLPRYLELCVDVLDRLPGVVLSYAKTRIIDGGGHALCDYDDRMHLDMVSAAQRFGAVLRRLRKVNALFGVIRADVLRQTRLVGAYSSSDLVLVGELALRGRFYEVPEVLFLRRDHPGASMRVYPDPRERNAWFDPAGPMKSCAPSWRLLREYAGAVSGSGLGVLERGGCYIQLRWWIRRTRRELLQELKEVLMRASRAGEKIENQPPR